jgi:nucleoside-diphosphate-sugar epimerase
MSEGHRQMKILVTGSSGRIGSKIAEVVTQRGTCIGVDLVPGRFTTHHGTITDPNFMDEIIQGVDAIIHSAAYLTPHVGVISDAEFRRVNVHGTEVLLDLALRHKIPRFVFTSTTSVYGCTTRPKAEAIWVTEALAPNPEDIYDFTKLEAEQLCQAASHSVMAAIILRMSRCFPEPDYLMAFYRLYRGVSRLDVAKAHWLAASCAFSGADIFNISAASPFQPTDTKALLDDPWQVIERIYPGAGELYDQLKWEKPSSIDRVYVIDKARQLLNYQPRDNFWEYLQSKVIR